MYTIPLLHLERTSRDQNPERPNLRGKGRSLVPWARRNCPHRSKNLHSHFHHGFLFSSTCFSNLSIQSATCDLRAARGHTAYSLSQRTGADSEWKSVRPHGADGWIPKLSYSVHENLASEIFVCFHHPPPPHLFFIGQNVLGYLSVFPRFSSLQINCTTRHSSLFISVVVFPHFFACRMYPNHRPHPTTASSHVCLYTSCM